MSKPIVKFIKTRTNAVTPRKGTPHAVGYDLTCVAELDPAEYNLPENVRMFDTGISVEPPSGYYTEIVPRSSLIKSGYMLGNSIGIIDPDYRGSLKIAIVKIEKHVRDIEAPFKMFQLVLRKYEDYELVVETKRSLTETTRGAGGFGSTDACATVSDSKRSVPTAHSVPVSHVSEILSVAPVFQEVTPHSAECCRNSVFPTSDTIPNPP